jgi:hypothetical protein
MRALPGLLAIGLIVAAAGCNRTRTGENTVGHSRTTSGDMPVPVIEPRDAGVLHGQMEGFSGEPVNKTGVFDHPDAAPNGWTR